ncbi:MAG: acyl-CoA dehydrogenase family protein [Bacillota bacterium]
MRTANREELLLLRKVAREIAQNELSPEASWRDLNYAFSREAFNKLAEAGFTGMLTPKSYHGSGGNLASFVLVLEELAKGCASTALSLLAHVVATKAVTEFGVTQLKATILPFLATGERIAAFAVHEAASGAIAGAIETRADVDGDNYVVNGSKFFVTNGGVADLFIVLVRTDSAGGAGGTSLLLIERNTAGLTVGHQDKRMGMNGTASTEIVFDHCCVPQSHLLGEVGKGLQSVVSLVTRVGMPGMSAIALGLAQAALDNAIKHSKERTIAGQPIAALVAVQFLVAEMSATVEAMRGMLVYSLQQDRPVTPLATKLFVTEKALEVIDKALQVHGGHGYSREIPIERFYREARGLKLHYMTSEILKVNIAKTLLEL